MVEWLEDAKDAEVTGKPLPGRVRLDRLPRLQNLESIDPKSQIALNVRKHVDACSDLKWISMETPLSGVANYHDW